MTTRITPRMKARMEARGGKLTEGDLELLRLIAVGLTNAAIAEQQGCPAETLKCRLTVLFCKMGAQGRTEAATRWLLYHSSEPDREWLRTRLARPGAR